MTDRDGVVPAQALAQLVPSDGGFAPVEEGGQRHARAEAIYMLEGGGREGRGDRVKEGGGGVG